MLEDKFVLNPLIQKNPEQKEETRKRRSKQVANFLNTKREHTTKWASLMSSAN
jgi:hypothetical protein